MKSPLKLLLNRDFRKSDIFNLKISITLAIILISSMVLQFLFPIGLIVLIYNGSGNFSNNVLTDLYLMGIIWVLIDYFVLWNNSKTLTNEKINPILGIIGLPQFLFGSIFSGFLLIFYFIYMLVRKNSMDFIVINALDISPVLILSGFVILLLRANVMMSFSIFASFSPVILGLAFQIISIFYFFYLKPNSTTNRLKASSMSLISLASSGALAIFIALDIYGIFGHSATMPLESTLLILLLGTVSFSFHDVSKYMREYNLSPTKVNEIQELAYNRGIESGRTTAWYEYDSLLGNKLKDKFDEGVNIGYQQGWMEAKNQLEEQFKTLENRLKSTSNNKLEKAKICIELFNLEKPNSAIAKDLNFWVSFDSQVKKQFGVLAKIVHPDASGQKGSSGMFRMLDECRSFLQSDEFRSIMKEF